MPNDAERRIAFLASALEEANVTLRGKMDELSLVRRVGDAISHHTSIEILSAELVNALAEPINCKYAMIYAGSGASPFDLQAVSSVFSTNETFPDNIRHTPLSRDLEQNSSPIQIDNILEDSEWSRDWPFSRNLLSWLCVPLATRNHLRGVLCLADDAAAAFDERTLRTLMIVVPQISSAFANIEEMTQRVRLMEQIARAQKMESIGTLASGVAHDFNNILGIILPNAELIKLRTDPESPATRFADVIIKASKRAAQLTKQLLSLSRNDAVSMKIVSVNEAVRATGRLLAETLDRRIHIEFDLWPESTNIKADETQIEQVLLNLAINARDAMPGGGVLKFSTCSENGNVTVRVTDTGTGIDRSILPKIFDPFFTTKDKSKGTGLGLSVVYGIVEHIGGSVDVKSEVGIGTEFVITFPSSSELRRRPGTEDVRLARGSEKIMIVDDEPEMLVLIETTLRDLGYSVVAARNGVEAIELLEGGIRLIILDMIMPEMDGVTALRCIRQKTPDVKVLICSGYTSPDKVPVLERIGIEGFVQKPFELAKLAATVRDVLDGVAV